jgi:ubiquinone/menaquinone biosynthesis C-methylase UbiE
MRIDAREESKKQWNAIACGELDGDKNQAEYFLSVKKERYRQQSWVKDYFEYNRYSGKKVLEIGVGQGTDLMQFADAGAECYGMDITDNHLMLTKKNFQLIGKQVNLQKADATQLPFSENYFDCVYSFGVLHHIPEIKNVLAEVNRVLKPGGIFMIALYHKWSAFHLFCKLLANGIRNGWLFTKGYDGLLATIEKGADGVRIKPYVKLYSKKEVEKLMDSFSINDISIYQLERSHFWPPIIGRLMNRWIPYFESYLGWYVTCKAQKSEKYGDTGETIL